MQKPIRGTGHIGIFLYHNRIESVLFAMIFGFGGFFGRALFRALYAESFAQRLDGLYGIEDSLPLSAVLLYAVLPAFLFICCMLLCAYVRRALPLWGLSALFAGVRCGMSVGMLASAKLLLAAALHLPLIVGQAALALISLDERRAPSVDAYRCVDRFLIPATVYLVAVSLIQLVFAALFARGFH